MVTLSKMAGAVLLIALLLAGPVQAGPYNLDLSIAETGGAGSSATATSGPFSGAGHLVYNDFQVTFPDFTSLGVTATSNQTGTSSFLNEVSISGVLASTVTSPVTLTIELSGVGFTEPIGAVTVQDNLSSSNAAGTFTTAALSGSVGAIALAAQSITPPNAGNPLNTFGSLAAPYTAEQILTINGLEFSDTNNGAFNITANVMWTSSATPEPAGIILALSSGLPFLGFRWLRRRRQATT